MSEADAMLAGQLADWHLDLEARQAMLNDVEDQLANAELGVTTATEALTEAEHAPRRRAAARANVAGDELHAAELRYSDLNGRQAAIRERLETE